MSKSIIVAVVGLICVGASTAAAQEVRYFDKDGITYKETRRVVQRAVPTTAIEQRQQVVYRQQVTVENREQVRTVQTPVVEYQWVPRLHGRWNPFMQPYVVHEQVPITRWESRSEIVTSPITRSEWVPETRVVDVPVITNRVANEEIVSTVAIGQAGTSPVGGVARLDSDIPSQGWQNPTTRRQ